MKKLIIILIILTQINKSYSQDSKLEYGVFNVGFGGVVGGFGALINKQKDEKPVKVFANGFWKGAIGGGMVHLSKLSVGEIGIKNDYKYSWIAKFNNSVGTSFIENATLNRPLLSNFNINLFGFNRLEISSEKHFKVKYKIMPTAFLLNTYALVTSKFEFEKTLSTGELIYSNNNIINDYRGFTLGTSIVMNSRFTNSKKTISHELIHVYQYYDYLFMNSFLKKPLDSFKSKNNFFNNDYIYYDLQYPVLLTLYSIEKSKDKYYDNFFEKEAGFYSNTLRDY